MAGRRSSRIRRAQCRFASEGVLSVCAYGNGEQCGSFKLAQRSREQGGGAWTVEVVGKVPFAGWVGLGPPDFGGYPHPSNMPRPASRLVGVSHTSAGAA